MNRPRLRRLRWRLQCVATAIRVTVPMLGPLLRVWRQAFTVKQTPPVLIFTTHFDASEVEAKLEEVDRELANIPLP